MRRLIEKYPGGYEDWVQQGGAPGILENVLPAVADNLPTTSVKDIADPAVKEQAPTAQAPRTDVIPAAKTALAREVGERILKEPAAGADPSTTDVTAPLKRPPTVPISLPFASPARPPLAASTPAVADHPAEAPPNLVQPSSALPTLPATTFNPDAAPTLSVTPPTPLTPKGSRAGVESPLIDSPAPQP